MMNLSTAPREIFAKLDAAWAWLWLGGLIHRLLGIRATSQADDIK